MSPTQPTIPPYMNRAILLLAFQGLLFYFPVLVISSFTEVLRFRHAADEDDFHGCEPKFH